MTSQANRILEAVRGGLAAVMPAGVAVTRNPVRAAPVPRCGAVALWDDPEPAREEVLGVRCFDYTHRATVELVLVEENDQARAARAELLMERLAAWAEANRRGSGALWDWLELEAARPVNEELADDAPLGARIAVPLVISYCTRSDLG